MKQQLDKPAVYRVEWVNTKVPTIVGGLYSRHTYPSRAVST